MAGITVENMKLIGKIQGPFVHPDTFWGLKKRK